MEFRELSEQEYINFASNHPLACFQQTAQMRKVKETGGVEGCYLGVVDQGQVVAASYFTVTKIMKIYRYFYASRGLLIDYENQELLNFYLKELKKYGRCHHGLFCRIDPNVQLIERDINGQVVEDGFDRHSLIENMKRGGCAYCGEKIGFDPRSQMRFMFNLDLKGKTEQELLKQMSAKTRWSINKAESLGIEVRELSYEELPLYKAIMDETCIRRHFEDRDLAFYQQMKTGFQDDFKCMVAQLNVAKTIHQLKLEMLQIEEEKQYASRKKQADLRDRLASAQKYLEDVEKLQEQGETMCMLAVASFITTGKEVVYFTAGNDEDKMKYNGTFAIHWHMLKWALEHGYERYNFYGISGNFSSDAEDYGVYLFKKGFNGVVEEYVGDFILPMNPLFAVYDRIKKII